jgi:calcium-dependent protein kinase
MGCAIERICCPNRINEKKNDNYESNITSPVNNMYIYTEPTKLKNEDIISESDDDDDNTNANCINDVKINTSTFVLKKDGLPSDYYENICILGEGAYGTVYKVSHKESGGIRALKTVKKNILVEEETTNLEIEREINIIKRLDHPNIMKIYEYFIDDEYIYIVGEYYSEGSLCDKLEQMNMLNEYIVKLIMFEILTAVSYLHCNNIIHGDLKLENIMIEKLNFE